MEPIGKTVTNPSMLGQQPSSQESDSRIALIEMQIRRMAISTHTPPPNEDRLALLVSDAISLWKNIPDAMIPEAVTIALRESGNFMPSNGKVAGCWEKITAPKPLELGRADCSSTMDAYKAEDARLSAMTPEEREREQVEWEGLFRGLRVKVLQGDSE